MRGRPACGFTVPTCRKPVKFDTISYGKYNALNGPDGLAPMTEGLDMRELFRDKFYCEVSEDFYPALPNGLWTALFGKDNIPTIHRYDQSEFCVESGIHLASIDFNRPVALERLVCALGPLGLRKAMIEDADGNLYETATFDDDSYMVTVPGYRSGNAPYSVSAFCVEDIEALLIAAELADLMCSSSDLVGAL